MAASICASCSLTFFFNGIIKNTWPDESCTIPVSGDDFVGGTIRVSTTPKDLPLAEVTPGGVAAFRNMSKVAAEVIHLRRTSSGPNIITLKPGEFFIFRLGLTAAPKIVSEEGTPLLRYFVSDD
jgi:hypothetical protein